MDRLHSSLPCRPRRSGWRALGGLLLCAALAAGPASLFADERSSTQKEIRKAQQDIVELEKLIKQIQAEKSDAQKALQGTEKDIGELEKNIRSLEA